MRRPPRRHALRCPAHARPAATLLYGAVLVVRRRRCCSVPGLLRDQPAAVPGSPGRRGTPSPVRPATGGDVHQLLTFSVARPRGAGRCSPSSSAGCIAGRFLRPLRTITATARDISASNLHRRLASGRRDDEFKELGADARRPVRTPGGIVRVAAALRGQRLPRAAHPAHRRADPAAGGARRSGRHAQTRCAARARRCWRSASSRSASSTRCSPWPAASAASSDASRSTSPTIAAKVLTGREAEARRRDIRVDATLGPAAAAGDPSLVESMVANLIDNALRHNLPGGHIDVTTATVGGTLVPHHRPTPASGSRPANSTASSSPSSNSAASAYATARDTASAWPSSAPSPTPTPPPSPPKPPRKAASTSRSASPAPDLAPPRLAPHHRHLL